MGPNSVRFSTPAEAFKYSPSDWDIKLEDNKEGVQLNEKSGHFALRCISDFCRAVLTFGRSKPSDMFERKVLYVKVEDLKSRAKELEEEVGRPSIKFASTNYYRSEHQDEIINSAKEIDALQKNEDEFRELMSKSDELYKLIYPEPTLNVKFDG
jgi:hypothetical protein